MSMRELSGADQQQHEIIETFSHKAQVAGAVVSRVRSFQEAATYAVALCRQKELSRLEIGGEPEAAGLDSKLIAAPALEAHEFDELKGLAGEQVSCLRDGLRRQLAGVDVGFTYADLGLAETGTIVINCPGEELRLATMISEYHVCLLPQSRILPDAFAAEPQLRKYMLNTPNYTAFITGPSRTADIERVLTIGVHGPLELHVLVLEE